MVTTIGLRELRQRASDLVRQAEAGETVTVTVSGREVAQLVPMQHDRWRHWAEVAAIFAGSADTVWNADRDRVNQAARDPFATRDPFCTPACCSAHRRIQSTASWRS